MRECRSTSGRTQLAVSSRSIEGISPRRRFSSISATKYPEAWDGDNLPLTPAGGGPKMTLMAENPVAVARGIVLRLRDAGHQAYFAGGCVRDRLLGIDPPHGDFDVATSARPAEVERLFPHTVAVGAQFGVILVVEGDARVEVATFRADDAYVDGRHPTSVRFTTPEEDAERRDFTINGMFADPVSGEVLDFVGGRRDLELRMVRAI